MAQPDPASLQKLHDIVAAPPVPWFPPAPGWYVIAVFFLIAVACMGWWIYRRWKTDAYRRAALDELKELTARLKNDEQRKSAMRKIPGLLKRTGLAVLAREKIAGLNGERWLAFLDASSRTSDFSLGPGKLLLQIAYAGDEVLGRLSDDEVASVIRVTEHWIKKHRV